MAIYASIAELKTKNNAVELTHVDDEITELLEYASREIDYLTEKPKNFWQDSDDSTIKAVTLFLALNMFEIQSAPGVASMRIGDRSKSFETPERVRRRAKMALEQHNPPSLIDC